MRYTDGKISGARIPLWVALIGLITCEPETFAIVSREIHDELWQIAQNENDQK